MKSAVLLSAITPGNPAFLVEYGQNQYRLFLEFLHKCYGRIFPDPFRFNRAWTKNYSKVVIFFYWLMDTLGNGITLFQLEVIKPDLDAVSPQESVASSLTKRTSFPECAKEIRGGFSSENLKTFLTIDCGTLCLLEHVARRNLNQRALVSSRIRARYM